MRKTLILLFLFVALVGCNKYPHLQSDGNKLYYGDTPVGTFLPVTNDAVAYDDQIELLDDNTLKITRTFTALQDIDSVRLTFNFSHESFIMIWPTLINYCIYYFYIACYL